MFLNHGLSAFNYEIDNWPSTPSVSAAGTSVTPGASNVEGSWTQIFSAVTYDCYWLALAVYGGQTSAQIKNHLLDIGIDPAGGSSYTALYSDLGVGESNALAQAAGGWHFLIPIFIPAGASVAVRIQGNNATAGTVGIIMKLWGNPSRPHLVPVGRYAENIGGVVSSSAGVGFTPGASGVDGSWQLLGTTANDLWWWQMLVQCTNNIMNAEVTYIELAFGDGTNFQRIMRGYYSMLSNETFTTYMPVNCHFPACYQPVPGGSGIYIRGRCSAATPTTGYTAQALGIGG